MTLVEVAVGSTVLALLSIGILAAFLQSRRLTEGSIYQNAALTAIQGYLEQIKSIEFAEIPYYDGNVLKRPSSTEVNHVSDDDVIYTVVDQNTPDPLRISPGSPPDLSTLTPGVTPEGVIDNIKVLDVNGTDGRDGRPDVPEDDLHLNVWVWVQPLETGLGDVSPARAITLIYTWQFRDGTKVRQTIGSVRTVRSEVVSF